MLLLFAAALGLVVGILFSLFGQERRVRGWILIVCLSAAAVTTGLYVEMYVPEHAFLAARVNMSSAILLASAAVISMERMVGLRLPRTIVVIIGIAIVLNVTTVWLTDLYFTGEYLPYPSGGYVAGDPLFLVNPLLIAVIAVLGLSRLVRAWPRAHPLDRNRIKYVLLAYGFLAFSVLDYLPHFGWNPFGGAVSAFFVPLFLVTFGYATVRYRLLEFRALVARASGWLFTLVLVATVYVLVLEGMGRWLGAGATESHVASAAISMVALVGVGATLPGWIGRALGVDARVQDIIDEFSQRVAGVLDETALRERLHAVCTGPIGGARVAIVDPAAIDSEPALLAAISEAPVAELELIRRRRISSAPLLAWSELVVPLRLSGELIGAIALGRRVDGGMYPRRILGALRTIGNLFTMALANARAAAELAQRHQLDRYLPPQIVERVLLGQGGVLEGRRRVTVTIFFSDLKDFTGLADRLDPDVLSTILNEYLSEMSEIAFRHGGTIDKFIGDAVMVFFGAPMTLPPEEQVDRALRMASEMDRRLGELNVAWSERGLLEGGFTCRMGIHTGEATVGSFGSRVRAEYTAIGSAVNLAARLESACTPGRILVSAATWAHVGRPEAWKATPRGSISAKGFACPIEVVEVEPGGAAAVARAAAGGE
jgi:class 3 adenylate cyclase